MLTLRRLLAGSLLLGAAALAPAQEIPPDPTNTLQFEYSVAPTNNAILITETTNRISVTISNWIDFTNIVITGQLGTNQFSFNPGDDDGVFVGELLTPLVMERTPITIAIQLIGVELATAITEPPADPLVVISNRTERTYIVVPRPPNDRFTNAFKLLSAGETTLGTNQYASLERGEPSHASVPGHDRSIWWTWSAPASGNVLFDLAGTEFPAILSVYRGDRLTNLVSVASSTNDTANRLPPNVVFNASQGLTYRIAVSGLDSNSFGRVRLRVAPGGTPDTRPPVVAILTPAQDSLVTDELLAVTGSAREPFPLDSGVSNVVLRLNGQVVTNAVGTDAWSAVIALPPGTNIVSAVAHDFAGNASQADSVVVRFLNPTNTYFALASQLPGTGGFVAAHNRQAIKESGEPFHAGNEGGRSVWYWWRAPSDGRLDLTTSGSPLDTLLAVYIGNALTNLTELVSNDDAFPGVAWSETSLLVSSNTVYRIAVDAFGAAVGEFGLQYVFTPLQAGTFFNLTVSPANGGAVSPPGGAFPSGARVTLTAVPQPDFAFVGWEGDVASTQNPIDIAINRNLRVTPRFRTVRFTDDFETGDLSRIPWTQGDPPWIVQTNVVAAGSFALRTPPIDHRQTAVLSLTTNTGSGTASFDVRVSTEPAWDFFEFLIDDTVVRRWSGEVPWQTVTFNVSAGTHTFTWRYTKDPNFQSGLDAAFLDNLYLPPPSGSGSGGQQPTLTLTLFSEGGQLTLQGEPGVTYDFEAAPSLAGPWSVIGSQSSSSGIINLLDLEAVGQSRRFYRARTR
ncbi:MAG: hypothetical protein KF833_07910 [Verrucomicrobiae bacterium]|nr:hypothetical protein [Verrucomicrobiae bacterium]